MSSSVGLAIVGGHRGGAFRQALAALSDQVRLVAACDLDEGVLLRWREDYPRIRTYVEFEQVLDDSDVDAVLIATPLQLHATQAMQALNHGKHVLSEVVAATTLDECWALVEAVERTGLVYMLAENYCYTRPNMMVLNMVQQGFFGPIVHAEGAYLHDCRGLMHDRAGNLTWRGLIHKEWNGATYPTHSLGPVAQWLGVNQPGGDQLDWLISCASAPRSVARHFRDTFGSDHPGAADDYWRHGDSQITVIRTRKGACILLRLDRASPRPHNTGHYALQGTTACYLGRRQSTEDPLIWIEGRSPHAPNGAPKWEPLWAYAEDFEHPYWQEHGSAVAGTGHGGGDFFVIYDFLRAIKQGGRPAIDVYDAVTWSSIIPLSIESIKAGSSPVQVPDFHSRATD